MNAKDIVEVARRALVDSVYRVGSPLEFKDRVAILHPHFLERGRTTRYPSAFLAVM
jgi:hypothetical protein